MEETSRIVLDHIAVLVPPTFLTTSPPWLAESFHFTPGGQLNYRHADTGNALVLLADGSYIEFLAFAEGSTPEQRGHHKWGKYAEGTVVDWALTVIDPTYEDVDADFGSILNISSEIRKSGAGIVFGKNMGDGRIRPDGARLEWVTIQPLSITGDEAVVDHGQVPFWCLDGTPRDLRVPYQSAGATTHPCGAVGVAEINITPSAAADNASDLRRVYTEVLRGPSEGPWKVGVLESGGAQRDATVSLSPGDSPAHISISLYTDRPELAGKLLGGEGAGFQFKLVGI